MEKEELNSLNIRISAIEEAVGNYGNHIRLLNDGVAALQTAFAQTAETLSQPSPPAIQDSNNDELIESVLAARTIFTTKNRTDLAKAPPEKTEAKSFEDQLAQAQSWGYNILVIESMKIRLP